MFKKQVLLGSAKSLLWRKCKLTLPLYVTYVIPSLSTNDNLLPFDFFHMNAGWYEYIYYFRFQLLIPSLFLVDRCRRSLLQKETGIYFTCSEILYLQWYENWLINYWLTCPETWTIWLTLNFRHLFCTLVSEKTRPFSFSCKLRIVKVTVVKKI